MNPWQGLTEEVPTSPAGKRRAAHPHIENPWRLTPVQCAVMTHYAEGLTAAEVGKVMNLSTKTIEVHLGTCKTRMGTDRRIKAVIAWDRFRRSTEETKT